MTGHLAESISGPWLIRINAVPTTNATVTERQRAGCGEAADALGRRLVRLLAKQHGGQFTKASKKRLSGDCDTAGPRLKPL
jgi:hypothetical protein